jgi:hypothetical protein
MSTFVLIPGGIYGDRSHLLSEGVDLETHIQDIVN